MCYMANQPVGVGAVCVFPKGTQAAQVCDIMSVDCLLGSDPGRWKASKIVHACDHLSRITTMSLHREAL